MNPTRLDPASILQTLRQVKDPELDCNIVDLGLVYGVAIDGAKVVVTMTLTSPGCPMSDSIRWGVQCALLNLEGVEDAEVNAFLKAHYGCPNDAFRDKTDVADESMD